MRLSLFWGLALVMGWSTLFAQAYQLQFKDAAGITRTYQTEVNIKGTSSRPSKETIPIQAVTKITLVERVMDVNDGIASMMVDMQDGTVKMVMNGQANEQLIPGSAMTFDRAPNGKISNMQIEGNLAQNAMKLDGVSGSNNIFSQFNQGFKLPDGEVKAGDVWKFSETVELIPGAKMTIYSSNKLIGTKVVDGKTYVQITTDITMKLPSMTKTIPVADDKTITTTMKMTTVGKSTTLWDEETGNYYSMSFTADTTMSMTMSELGSDPVTTNSKVNMTGWLKLAETNE